MGPEKGDQVARSAHFERVSLMVRVRNGSVHRIRSQVTRRTAVLFHKPRVFAWRNPGVNVFCLL